MKKFLIVATLLLSTLSLSAQQRQSDTKDYYKSTSFGTISMPGKMSRTFYLNNEGKKVLDGPISIKCTLPATSATVNYNKFSISGTYTLNGTTSKGMLNGAATSNYKLNVTNVSRGQTKSEYQTFAGGFANGLPNGAFKVNCNGELLLTATYSKGKLVGAYNYEEKLTNHKITGSLTQDGKLNGTWVYKSDALTTQTYQFVNGVLISEHYVDTSELSPVNRKTDAAISAMAQKYATGAITEEELKKQGYIIKSGKLDIGTKAYTAIWDYSGFIFDKSFCDFSTDNNVTYKTLECVNILNEAGVQMVINTVLNIDKAYREESKMQHDAFAQAIIAKDLCETSGGEGAYYYNSLVRLLDGGEAYVWLKVVDDTYAYINDNKTRVAYMTAEEFNKLKQAVHEARVANAINYIDMFDCFAKNISEYDSMDASKLSNIKMTITMKSVTLYDHPECEEYKITERDANGFVTYIHKNSVEVYQKHVNRIEELINKKQPSQGRSNFNFGGYGF